MIPECTVAFIKAREGFSAHAYKCQAGKWTIGYGSTTVNGHPVQPGQTITVADADIQCRKDIELLKAELSRVAHKPMTTGKLTALLSFAYNFGIGPNGLGGSTLLKRFNEGRDLDAANEFMRWVHYRDPKTGKFEVSEGLITRRKLERDLFLS